MFDLQTKTALLLTNEQIKLMPESCKLSYKNGQQIVYILTNHVIRIFEHKENSKHHHKSCWCEAKLIDYNINKLIDNPTEYWKQLVMLYLCIDDCGGNYDHLNYIKYYEDLYDLIIWLFSFVEISCDTVADINSKLDNADYLCCYYIMTKQLDKAENIIRNHFRYNNLERIVCKAAAMFSNDISFILKFTDNKDFQSYSRFDIGGALDNQYKDYIVRRLVYTCDANVFDFVIREFIVPQPLSICAVSDMCILGKLDMLISYLELITDKQYKQYQQLQYYIRNSGLLYDEKCYQYVQSLNIVVTNIDT